MFTVSRAPAPCIIINHEKIHRKKKNIHAQHQFYHFQCNSSIIQALAKQNRIFLKKKKRKNPRRPTWYIFTYIAMTATGFSKRIGAASLDSDSNAAEFKVL